MHLAARPPRFRFLGVLALAEPLKLADDPLHCRVMLGRILLPPVEEGIGVLLPSRARARARGPRLNDLDRLAETGEKRVINEQQEKTPERSKGLAANDLIAIAPNPVAVIIQQGKILDFIDSLTQRNETPEEYVRQEIAKSLVREYGYEKSEVSVEFVLRLSLPNLVPPHPQTRPVDKFC